MKTLGIVLALVAFAGCTNGLKVQVNPADVANAVACYAQVQTLASTAQQQVNACIELGASIKAELSAQKK